MAGRERRPNVVPELVRANQPEQISYADIEGIVGNLSGDDNKNTARWFDSFEEFAALARLSDVHKYIYCRRLMRGSAKSVVDTFMGVASYQELKEKILEEFGADASLAKVHRLLSNRKKNSNESSKQYYIHMKKLGMGLEPELIVQYVIEGIDDDEMNKIMLYGVKAGPQFNEKLELYDLIKKKKMESNTATTINDYQRSSSNLEFHPYKRSGTSHVNKKCFHCQQEGHIAKQCTNERAIVCFNCRERGHIKSQCKN